VYVREETPQDHEAIREVNRLAFKGEEEAQLVDRLRADGLVVASLVAVEDGQVVGHILFSELAIQTNEGGLRAVALAPMAVRPEAQRRGIGSALVRQGLRVCRERGRSAVIVVGHPAYYPRFGFSAERARNLRSPFSGDAFMALELTPRALENVIGTVRYPEAFGLAD
jgi:putative acetyltransferase